MENDLNYKRCIAFWDQVFSQEVDSRQEESTTGNEALDQALAWLCEGSSLVLDFGCGNGSMLRLCSLFGTCELLGIDLSQEAILLAKRRTEKINTGTFSFQQGGVELLASIPDASVDAIILSNIIDNLYPKDASILINECSRVLKSSGKVLVKLNPHLTKQQIKEWNIRTISGNLLDDGLLLWNNTTDEWRAFFSAHFEIAYETEIYYSEHDQTNRLFYLVKK